ncbi:MAG: hypothetical protein WCA92_10600, partial [Terriglobales bacterium]
HIARMKQKEFAILKECSHFVGICPICVNEEALRAESSVDETGDLTSVGGFGKAYIEGVHQSWILLQIEERFSTWLEF